LARVLYLWGLNGRGIRGRKVFNRFFSGSGRDQLKLNLGRRYLSFDFELLLDSVVHDDLLVVVCLSLAHDEDHLLVIIFILQS
jgi:hypothetical protein